MQSLSLRFLLRLAGKNLWRQKKRTFLTVTAIAVGLAGLLLVDSLTSGVEQEEIKNLIDLETGAVRLHARGYFTERENLPLDRSLRPQPLLRLARAVPGVKAATPRLVFAARLHTGEEEVPVRGVGIDPVLDRQVFTLAQYVQGRLPAAGKEEAALGRDLARLLELRQGDMFTLVTQTRDGARQALTLRLVGVLASPNPQVNQNDVYLPLGIAWAGLGLPEEATEVILRLAAGVDAGRVAKAVAAQVRARRLPVEVFTWREAAAEVLTMVQSKRGFDLLFFLLIMVVALVGVANTILLGAMERAREIGVMKAIGMTQGEIILLFMLEASGLGLLGSLGGCLIGLGVNFYLVKYGVDITRLVGDLDIGYHISGVLHGTWHWAMFPVVVAFGLSVCWLAGYWPARKAAAQNPAELLR